MRPSEEVVRLNYSVHFGEWLRRELSDSVASVDDAYSGWRATYLFAAILLEKAQHFLLPPGGWLLDDHSRLYAKYAPLMHLPFPVTAFEFFQPDKPELIQSSLRSSRRIALCFDASICKLWPMKREELVLLDDEFAVLCVCYLDEPKLWAVVPYMAKVSRSRTLAVTAESILELDKIDGVRELKRMQIGELVMDIRVGAMPGSERYETSGSVYTDIKDELTAAIQACAALNCSNVSTVSVPSSSVLNAKRLHAGRIPFVEYHVLDVPGRNSQESAASQLTGSHASPRQHLRRGHIRHLSAERAIWVNACVVGSIKDGISVKDYRMAK